MRFDQEESNGQIFFILLKANQGKDNREHLLEISVGNKTNKERYTAGHITFL